MKIRNLLAASAAILLVAPVLAQSSHSVRGYTRKDGTYVAPHRQTNPNGTLNDNWSTRGNTNPDTGREGTKPRDGESTQGMPRTRTNTYGNGY